MVMTLMPSAFALFRQALLLGRESIRRQPLGCDFVRAVPLLLCHGQPPEFQPAENKL
jgi:hypothetical protein